MSQCDMGFCDEQATRSIKSFGNDEERLYCDEHAELAQINAETMAAADTMDEEVKTCGHCGRQARILGGSQWTQKSGQVDLCHADDSGYKSTPDCYHLVTTGQEKLGARL